MMCGCECASNYSPELWCISCAHIKQTGRKCARWAELCPPSILFKYIFVTLTVMVLCLTGWPSMATCVLFMFSLSPPSHCLGRVHCRLRLCPSHLQLIILHSSSLLKAASGCTSLLDYCVTVSVSVTSVLHPSSSFSWHWFSCPCARFCMPAKGFVAVALLWMWWLGAASAWKTIFGRTRLAVWSSPVFSRPLR